MSHRGFGRRRTVLQLGDDTTKPTYGFGYRTDQGTGTSTFGALDMMANYDQSDEEEEEEEPSGSLKCVATGSKAMPVQMFVASKERLEPSYADNATNGRPVSPDTTKPKDEIDSKVQDFLAEIDAFDGPDTTSGEDAVTRDKTDIVTYSDDEDALEDPVSPVEPTTPWQQCMDESTQCCYYWHYVTNEVTWQTPPGYSKYLLQMKEYDDKLAKYKADLKNGVKKRKIKKKPVDKETTSKPSTSQPTSRKTEPDSQNIPDTKSKSQKQSKKKSKHKTEIPIGPQLPVELIGPKLPEPPPLPQEPAPKSPDPSVTQDTSNTIIGPSEAVPTETVNTKTEEKREGGTNDRDETLSLGEDMDVDDYIDRKLEETVYGPYDFVNKKYEGPQPDVTHNVVADTTGSVCEENELDLDIDRELENALERKKTLKPRERTTDSVKRKAPSVDPTLDNLTTKKAKKEEMQSEEDIDSDNVFWIQKQDIIRKSQSLEEIEELSDLLADKLEFLEVTYKGLSKLQVLLIEIQTRMQDWKDGALSTEHLLKKLLDASSQLEHYEDTAAPSGWSCHWDRGQLTSSGQKITIGVTKACGNICQGVEALRPVDDIAQVNSCVIPLQFANLLSDMFPFFSMYTPPCLWSCTISWYNLGSSKFKRYFYCHDQTGDTQWDYPTVPSSPAQHDPEEMLASVPPPPDLGKAPLPPPPPPPPQDQLPPVPDDECPTSTAGVEQQPNRAFVNQTNGFYAQGLGNLFIPPPPPPPPPPPRDEIPIPPQESEKVALETEPPPVSVLLRAPPPPPPPEESQSPINSPAQQVNDEDIDGVSMESDSDKEQSMQEDQSTHEKPKEESASVESEEMPVAERKILCGKPAHISAPPVLAASHTAASNSEVSSTAQALELPSAVDNSKQAPAQCEDSTPAASPTSVAVPASEAVQPVEAASTSAPPTVKEKKKKKEKNLVGGGLLMKKKGVTGLVQKWQKVQKEVEIEIAKTHQIEQQIEQQIAQQMAADSNG